MRVIKNQCPSALCKACTIYIYIWLRNTPASPFSISWGGVWGYGDFQWDQSTLKKWSAVYFSFFIFSSPPLFPPPKDCTKVLFIVRKDAKLGMCFERTATVCSFCGHVSFKKYLYIMQIFLLPHPHFYFCAGGKSKAALNEGSFLIVYLCRHWE